MLEQTIRAWESIARVRDKKDKELIRPIPLSVFCCVWKERNGRAFDGVEMQDTICVERWMRDLYFWHRQKDSNGTHGFVNMMDFI